MSRNAVLGIDEELFGKLVAFVDYEEGRDSTLPPADQLMIRGLIARDPKIRTVVDELRAINNDLDNFLDDTSGADVRHELVASIENKTKRPRKA